MQRDAESRVTSDAEELRGSVGCQSEVVGQPAPRNAEPGNGRPVSPEESRNS